MTDKPVCQICKRSGFGIYFSMYPKTDGYKFGDICTECDEKDSDGTNTG